MDCLKTQKTKHLQVLTINIIPFSHPTTALGCGFYKDKREGAFPLRKFEYPVSLWENYEEELQDCQRLYSDFTNVNDSLSYYLFSMKG